MKKISVIIPVYNVEKYLAKCLDSVLAQTYTNLEIICVNDGSLDNSLAILQDYQKKDDRIVIINQKNQGLAAARNAGLARASGDYIGFVDSDDFIDDNMYKTMLSKLENSGSDFAICNGYKGKDGAWSIKYPRMKNLPELINQDEQKASLLPYVSACFKLYKTEFIKNNKFEFPYGKLYEDNPFFMECLLKSQQICVVNECFYYHYERSGSITQEGDKNILQMDYLFVWLSSRYKQEDNLIYKAILLSKIASSANHVMSKINAKDSKKAFKMLLKTINIDNVLRNISFKNYISLQLILIKSYYLYKLVFALLKIIIRIKRKIYGKS